MLTQKINQYFNALYFSLPLMVQEVLSNNALHYLHSVEHIYADYNMQVGDSLKYYYNPTGLKVTSIDSIPHGNTYLTRYIVSGGAPFYEGAANSMGLFANFSLGIEGGTYLVCFIHQGESNDLGYSAQWHSCTPTVSGNLSLTTLATPTDMLIFPDPADERITIHYQEIGKYAIKVVNTLGMTMLCMQDLQGDVQLSLDNWPPGIYIVELAGNDFNTIGKFIRR